MAARFTCHAGRELVSATLAPSSDQVAFGFRLEGVRSHALARAHRPRWPVLHVRRRVGPTGVRPSHLGPSSARLSLGAGDWLELDRDDATATYLTTEVVDEDTLIHPRLAPAAALMARWLGREAFHAGALIAGGGAWALAGANEAGKSTLLAALAMRGTPVLTDDLLVVDRTGLAYAGPRCIDLRALDVVGGAVEERARSVRADTRQRLDLPPVTTAAALRGWLYLEWGSAVEAEPCSAHARIVRLVAQRRWATQGIDPRLLLDLAALPAWTLRRPRGGQHTDELLELLATLVGTASASAGAHDPGAPAAV